jgi:hypothetical protein
MKNLISIDWHCREEFWDWCVDAGCAPEYQSNIRDSSYGIWHIPDKKVYALALLRWE